MAIITSRVTTNATVGSGSITASTSSAVVIGANTLFTTQVAYPGIALYTTGDVYIGTVQSISSDTSITLTANAATSLTGNYKYGYLPKAAPLTNAEIDSNFINLNTKKLEITDLVSENLVGRGVKRDANGDFSARQITATLIGTASALVTTNDYQVKSLGVGTAASGTQGEIRASNAITSYYSDERLKENIKPIENALGKLRLLTGVTYNANDIAAQYGFTNKEQQVGLLAGDVEKAQPEAVKPAPFDIKKLEDGSEVSASGQNYKTVQYEKLVPLLVECIKALEQQIEELKGVK